MEKFKKSLKNPEFKKLFFDYVTELQDPENKRIYEEELAKLEAEKGNNVRYVKPEPWCVIKTKQLNIEHQIDKSNPNEKVFINICSSPEIQESKFNQQNKSWSIPYSLAKGREDYDKEKKPCYVYDCIFHPTTIKLGANPKFQNLIFTTAIEGIEKQFNFELKKDFKLLKMKSKGTPLMTIIREKMEGKPLPKETTYDFLKSLQQQKMEEDAKQSIPKAPIIEEIIESNENQKPIQPILEIPSFTIVHQSSFSDYQKYTSEKERQYGARPDALVIRIVLPKINSAKPVELDVTENALDLFVPNKYKLHLDLPFPVNDDKGTARFEKNTSTLIVTVPVVPVVVPVVTILLIIYI
ncbi:PIH1 family [Globomyces pollinis-pini]|nr:PIH1 family [Globomyces pollinis-pini]